MRIFIMRAPELTPAAAAAVVLIHSISAQWREGEGDVSEGAPMSEQARQSANFRI